VTTLAPNVTKASDIASLPARASLVVDNVTKCYRNAGREVRALSGVNLTIEHPGFYAIMGQSGSGKSTLLHLLAALDKPDSGTIHIAGEAVHGLSEKEATSFRRRRIGIVFQQFNLLASLTAQENVELPGMLSNEDPVWLRSRSDELLGALGLEGRGHHRPDALSGGEQQRVAIARALLFSPPVLYADEPTGNLDSASSTRLWSLLKSIAKQNNMLVVMVTHEPAAAAHCERIFVIRDGRVFTSIDTQGEGAPQGGMDAATVAARYQQCIGQA
jgi:putative ABC transport system ATP-binding protein